jgi:hypothetical protein
MEAYPTTEKIIIPPNLKFDPRSSFAPIEQQEQYKQQKRKQQYRRSSEVASTTRPEEKEKSSEEMLEEQEESDDEEDLVQYLTQPQQYFAIPLPDRLKVPVHTFFTNAADAVSMDSSSILEESASSSSVTGTLWLNETVFGLDPVRVDLLKRSVNYFRAKKRGMRTAKTKTISEVSGSGAKVRKQKGA